MNKKYINLKMIVCITKDNLLGTKNPKGNGLLWKSSEELAYFKKITMGHTLIFGKKTSKVVPLELIKKNRNTIILDHNMDIDKILDKHINKTIFVCGGYSIYKYFLENYIFSEIYLSVLKDHIKIEEATDLLYLPDLKDYGYVEYSKKEYIDFVACVYIPE